MVFLCLNPACLFSLHTHKIFPLLIAFNRRVPRTKSVFDRTSSRRYSSLDYDSNGFYDNHQEQMIIDNNNNEDIRQNHFHLLDSILRQNDDVFVSMNGHENFTVTFDDDDEDDSDEYACLSFLLVQICFILLCFDAFCRFYY